MRTPLGMKEICLLWHRSWFFFKMNVYFCHNMSIAVYSRAKYENHYSDIIMGVIASQITSITIVYSTVYSGAVQRKHQSSASLAFVWGIHWWLVNSPYKWPVTRKMFPFDDVIMCQNFWIFERCLLIIRFISYSSLCMLSTTLPSYWDFYPHIWANIPQAKFQFRETYIRDEI